MLWHRIAIDLGTTYSLVYTEDQGLLLREPSAVALQATTGEPIAFGERARTMLGRAPDFIEVVRPLREGVISHFGAARALLNHFMKEASRGRRWRRRHVLICVPFGATAVEMEALVREAELAGGAKVDLIREPFAASLGAGLPISEPRGNLVIDIGGGTTEVTALSLNDVVHCESLRLAGTAMDQAVQAYFRNRYNFLIGENTAEKIKIQHGSVYPNSSDHQSFEVKGLDHRDGRPARISVERHEVREALEGVVRSITEAVRRCVEQLAPELAADVFSGGTAMVGGGSLLPGWKERLEEAMGLQVRIADDALLCVVRGLREILRDPQGHADLIANSKVRHSIEPAGG